MGEGPSTGIWVPVHRASGQGSKRRAARGGAEAGGQGSWAPECTCGEREGRRLRPALSQRLTPGAAAGAAAAERGWGTGIHGAAAAAVPAHQRHPGRREGSLPGLYHLHHQHLCRLLPQHGELRRVGGDEPRWPEGGRCRRGARVDPAAPGPQKARGGRRKCGLPSPGWWCGTAVRVGHVGGRAQRVGGTREPQPCGGPPGAGAAGPPAARAPAGVHLPRAAVRLRPAPRLPARRGPDGLLPRGPQLSLWALPPQQLRLWGSQTPTLGL